MKFGLLLIMLTIASENQENKVKSGKSEEKFQENNAEDVILVKIEEDECTKEKKKTSQYFGVSYSKSKKRWRAQRWGKSENKPFSNGYYKDEKTAAHASDTLARNLMENGEQNLKLNFRDDHTVFPEKITQYFGVSYRKSKGRWRAQRWSKSENKPVYNGSYKNEETAAHSSDTLARKLMENGEHNHKLNFPDDNTEVFPEKNQTSKYFGVYYSKSKERWNAHRRSKSEKKMVTNGAYKDEEAAAHASDTLARKLMENGEQDHKLNFPYDHAENEKNKRKRSEKEDQSK